MSMLVQSSVGKNETYNRYMPEHSHFEETNASNVRDWSKHWTNESSGMTQNKILEMVNRTLTLMQAVEVMMTSAS